MPTLQVRDLPEDIYRRLVEQAKKEHRSIARQATVELAKALNRDETNIERRKLLLKNLKYRRKSWNAPRGVDPVQLVREDRDR